MKHGVLLVGCGAMAHVHCTALANHPNIDLISAVDLDINRAKKFQDTYGFKRTGTDYRDELDKADFDIVLLAAHWWHRYKMILDCFAAGKHVLAEKPLTLYMDELDSIFAAANSKGLKLRVGMMERFRPMFLKISELLAQDAIGKPQVYSFIHHQRPTPSRMDEGWDYFKTMMRGGVTPNIDCGIHKCDLVRMFSGAEAQSVLSVGQKLEPDSPANNYTHSVFTMTDGSTLTLEDCWSGATEPFIYMWMTGTKGRILFEYAGAEARPNMGSEEDCIRVWHRDNPHTQTFHTPLSIKPVGPQMDCFINEIEQDLDMNWHYTNVHQATEMVLGTALSEHRGEIVHFPLTPADHEEAKSIIIKG